MTKKIVNEIKSVVKNRKKKVESKLSVDDFTIGVQTSITMLSTELKETNNRIDRIVEAIDKSKKVRGL